MAVDSAADSVAERFRAALSSLRPGGSISLTPWTVATLVVVAMLLIPLASIFVGVFGAPSETWRHLASTVLADYIRHSVLLVVGVGALTLAIGIVVVSLNTFIDKVPGNYTAVTNKLGLLVPPLFALFFLALFVPFATPFGAIFGTIYGTATACLVAFWDLITTWEPISFQWISPVSLAASVLAGVLLSLLPTRGRKPAAVVFWSLVAAVPFLLAVAGAIVWRHVPALH